MKYIQILFLFFIFLMSGCISTSSSYNTKVLDGTLVQFGLFVPYQGNLYGIQCLNYVSGRSTKINFTNEVISIHTISNKFNNEVYSLELKK